MNEHLQGLKMKYIPLCANGDLSVRKCAKIIGIKPFSVSRLKKRYKEFGGAIFIHGNTGRKPKNKRIDDEKVYQWYINNFKNAPFAVASDVYAQTVHPLSYI